MLCSCGKEYHGNFCPYCGRKTPQKRICQCGNSFEGHFCPYCGTPAGDEAGNDKTAAAGGWVGVLQKFANVPIGRLLILTTAIVLGGAFLLGMVVSLISSQIDQSYVKKAQNATYNGVTYKELFDHFSNDTKWNCLYTGDFEKYGFRFNAIVEVTGTCLVNDEKAPYTVTFHVADNANIDDISGKKTNVRFWNFEIETDDGLPVDAKDALMKRVYDLYQESHPQLLPDSTDTNDDITQEEDTDEEEEDDGSYETFMRSESTWVLDDWQFTGMFYGQKLYMEATDYEGLMAVTHTPGNLDLNCGFGLSPDDIGSDGELIYYAEWCQEGDAFSFEDCDYILTYYSDDHVLTLHSDSCHYHEVFSVDSDYINKDE